MRVFKLRTLKVAVLAVLLLGFAAAGFAQKVTHYTADQVTIGKDGKPIGQSKVYLSGEKNALG